MASVFESAQRAYAQGGAGRGDTQERSVVFTDGTEVECDAIVCNTGYKTQLPYMEKYCSGARAAGPARHRGDVSKRIVEVDHR